MSYTNKDLDNGITYSNNRYALRIINTLHAKLPHLISHMEYSIRQADPTDDYYYPSTFAHRAIVVHTKIPELLCSKISCNSIMAESVCKRSTPASYYNIGDSPEFRRQCEPACFNLLKDPVIDEETGEEQVQMLRLEYNDKYGCVILPTAAVWHEHPFYRSETVYEHRLNDLPVGFNVANPDPYSYSGMTYKYNKSYCDAFYDQWDGNKCIKKWWETVLYAVVGESIIKMVKAGIQTIENGYKSDYPPVTIPTIPDIEDVWTLEGWTNDINEFFIVPPIEYEIPPTLQNHIQREVSSNNNCPIENQFSHLTRLKIIKSFKNKHRQISTKLRQKLETYYDLKILTQNEKDEIQHIKDTNKRHPTIILISKQDGSEGNVLDIVSSVIDSLLMSVFTPGFWIDIGIGITSDVILDQMKVIFRKLSNDIIPKLTSKLISYTGKLMSKVFAKSIYATIANTMSKIVIKTVSKVMIQLTKLVAELASVVGIILAIITIFDILLTIWDPLGFNNKFDEEIINSVTRSSDIAMRQNLEVSIPTMTFEIFTNMCLTPEEIIDESLNTFKYIYEYLDALTVNSEGSRIDKGTELDLNGLDGDNLNNVSIVNSKLITPKELYDYEFDHSLRMKFYIQSTSIITGVLAISVLFMLFDMWFMAVIFFILLLLIILISYFNGSSINVVKVINDTMRLKGLIV